MRAAKIDANHNEVVSALRKAGATVQSLAGVGAGVPDLLVGFRNKTSLIEVKDGAKPPSARKLTPDQLKWHREWNGGTLAVVDSPEAALRVLGLMAQKAKTAIRAN
jgi:Holliday junction resolvase